MFRKILTVAATAALVVAGALVAQPASATVAAGTPITIVTGNADKECQQAGYDYGIKLDTGTPGTYTVSDFEDLGHMVTIKVTISADGVVSFENADPPVSAVLIKAGQTYDIWRFDPPVTSAGGMEPTEKFGISHVTFCYDGEPRNEPEDLTVTKSVNTRYERSHDWSVDKSVDKTDVKLYIPGSGPSSATVTWTVDVLYGGPTDSGHTVYGTVTVKNTGGTTAGLDELTDTLTLNGIPTVVPLDCGDTDLTGALAVPLAPGESLECTYSVPVDGAVTGFNEATATTLSGGSYSTDEPVDIVWGAPAVEHDATVWLSDSKAGALGSFAAADGNDSVTYNHTFNWGDYGKDNCGDKTYDNTATLVGDGNVTIDTDNESVAVHVQCYVFQGETAWAAGTRYVPKGNWAMYVKYTSSPTTYMIKAGQSMDAGSATITTNGSTVTVTVNLSNGWTFASGVGDDLKIQQYSSTPPQSNPAPGQFQWKTDCTGTTCTISGIPLAMYYGIHLDVGHLVPDPNF